VNTCRELLRQVRARPVLPELCRATWEAAFPDLAAA
jgi:hypothetical protein